MERSTQPEASFAPTSATELLEHIRQAPYDSVLRKLPRTLPRLALSGVLSPDQVGMAMAAIEQRRAELVAVADPEGLSEADQAFAEAGALPAPVEEWTPTGVLDRLPTGPDEPDWLQRQLPNGDRD